MDLDMLKRRAVIIRQVRSFFDGKNYLELDTPLLSPDLIPESCLEVFETQRLFPHGSRKERQPLYLIPSPEIYMKKIIARHRVNVFQVCKCFRNGESEGFLHNSEFTMLEYYTMNAGYMDSLALTEELFGFLNMEAKKGSADLRGFTQKEKSFLPFERMTVAEAFARYAGFDLFAAASAGAGEMAAQARRLGLEPMDGMTVPQLYDLIFIHSVEPYLKMERPVALIDYPAFVPCLAKKAADGLTVERWELYYNGIELANCFSEEIDPLEVKNFFISEEAQKEQSAIVRHKADPDYWKLFEQKAGQSFPRCSGVAMGLDRLIMALTGKASIDGALPFAHNN